MSGTRDRMIIDTSWSLNRVHIAGLPGLDVPDKVKGKVAYELVSAHVLTRLIRQHIAELQLDANLGDHALRLAYDASLESNAPSVRVVAACIAQTIGRNLGYVLLTLKRGDAVNRTARPEWGFAHWNQWAGIRRVWLGGGLVSGNLGPHTAHHANLVIQEGGIDDLTVQVSPYAAHLPLIGAARHLPPGIDAAVVLDFGSTRIKRARVVYKDDQIIGLYHLLSQSVTWPSVSALDRTSPEQAAGLIHGMASLIAETWRTVRSQGPFPAETIPVSIAAYVKDGNPLVAQAGVYMQTNLVTDNLEDELGLRVGAELDAPVSVKLFHDGTAAAATYAGEARTAVITLGTALGVGFPGDAVGLRPICDELVVGQG